MCAQFNDIQQIFAARNLRVPTLNVLRPDSQLYETLAIQPTGAVTIAPTTANPDFVGHANRARAIAQYTAFLDRARQLNSDLVLSPEYSFPWEVLTGAITAAQLPAESRLWIFGCEAITPAQLRQTIADHPQVEWLSEAIPNGPGRFLNVLAYLCRTQTNAGEARGVVVLQFKHEPMGGNTFERDHLIRGQVVHIWRNPQDNIRLISLLCSDALVFNPAAAHECRFDRDPYVIFHPQLNPSPLHVDFGGYRGGLFSRNSDRFEVITLNWARGFNLPGRSASAYGGSTLYTKSPHFKFQDTRIEQNHRRGLHFAYWAPRRTQLFIFNFEEHVFRFRAPKVLQDVPAVEAARTGPEMLELLRWDAATGTWLDTPASDGFDALCQGFAQPCDYCTTAPHTVVDRERLFMLSTGNVRTPDDAQGWHHATNLHSFEAGLDEYSKRLTFTHEAAAASVTYRHDHLGRFIELQRAILTSAANYPSNIQDLAGSHRMVPPQAATGYRFNLESADGTKAPATVVFLGVVPSGHAASIYDNIVRLWGGNDKARRLVVWYREGNGTLRPVTPPSPMINDDSEPATSIAKGGAS
jgi:hypothetical protein